MISQQAVLEVALCFAGRELTDGEENVLSILCGGALAQWLGRLREDVTEEDCQEPIGGGPVPGRRWQE